MREENIQRPTTNIQHPLPEERGPLHWMLDVGCWMLDVEFLTFSCHRLDPGAGEVADFVAIHPQQRPFAHDRRADAAVKAEGVFVPAQRDPLEAAAAKLRADLGDACQQRASNAELTEGGANVEIVQKQTGTAGS